MELAKKQFMSLESKLNNHEVGLKAEDICSKYLQSKGYKILEQRFKCKAGEIDIIAYKKNLLAFVEVKRRKNALLDDPIGKTGKRRIANAALQYIYANEQYSESEIRFDFIFVDSDFSLSHTEAAWIMEE